jgi:ABC-type dipeptide/oligopeptide/nickel transport system permease subunit
MRRAALLVLAALILPLLAAPLVAPYPYQQQFRDAPDAAASSRFPLGTDALGRDRLSRMLYGGRLSLLCAPAAALVAGLVALALALAGGCGGRLAERGVALATDLCLSLPWLFALLAARAALPLDAPAGATVAVTFALLGALGWAGPCRVLLAAVRKHRQAEFVLAAEAAGCAPWRIAAVQIAPHLWKLAAAQFLVTVPAFLLAEANLGLLGLGVPEPLPSLGGMLRDLENLPGIPRHPLVLAPAVLLILLVSLFHLLVSADKETV